MVKFKIGDRVRAINENAFVRAGWEGVVDEEDDIPWVIWDNGKRYSINQNKLKLIAKTNNMNKVKVAVKCENESEHNALMKHMDSIGFMWLNGRNPIELGFMGSDPCVCIEDRFARSTEAIAKGHGYEVISFKAFAALKGIEYTPTPIVEVKLNKQYTATILDDKVVVGCQEFQFSVIEDLYHEVKKRIDNVRT